MSECGEEKEEAEEEGAQRSRLEIDRQTSTVLPASVGEKQTSLSPAAQERIVQA